MMQKEESEEGNESPRLSEVLAETVAKIQAESEAKLASALEKIIEKNPLIDAEAHQRHLEAERAERLIDESLDAKARRLRIRKSRLERWEKIKLLRSKDLTQVQISKRLSVPLPTIKRDYHDMKEKGEFPE